MLLLQQLGKLKPEYILVLFTVVLVYAILFYREEKLAEDPIMSITMLKKCYFLAMNMKALLIGGVVSCFEFYLPT